VCVAAAAAAVCAHLGQQCMCVNLCFDCVCFDCVRLSAARERLPIMSRGLHGHPSSLRLVTCARRVGAHGMQQHSMATAMRSIQHSTALLLSCCCSPAAALLLLLCCWGHWLFHTSLNAAAAAAAATVGRVRMRLPSVKSSTCRCMPLWRCVVSAAMWRGLSSSPGHLQQWQHLCPPFKSRHMGSMPPSPSDTAGPLPPSNAP
jgi:hypothetical protein